VGNGFSDCWIAEGVRRWWLRLGEGMTALRSVGSRKNLWLGVATLVFVLIVWVLRRPDQFFTPYIWAEEGLIFARFQHQGFWSAVTTPVNGQLYLLTNLALVSILKVKLLLYPVLAYIAATVFFMGFALLWLIPRSRLSLPVRSAIVMLSALVPANPETFGVLLYSFWWIGLYPVAILFWERSHWAWRVPLLVLASLTSTVGALAVVLFFAQWLFRRSVRDLISAFVLVPGLGLQSWLYITSQRAGAPFDLGQVMAQFLTNQGAYFFGWMTNIPREFLAFIGGVVLAGIGAAIVLLFRQRHPLGSVVAILGLGLVIVSFISAIPVPQISNQYSAGARYYFLPFLFLSWIVAVLASLESRRIRAIAVGAIIASIVTLGPGWTRHADIVDWRTEVYAACHEPTRGNWIYVHLAGSTADMWHFRIEPATCDSLYPQQQ
jgi:hypothetical protein